MKTHGCRVQKRAYPKSVGFGKHLPLKVVLLLVTVIAVAAAVEFTEQVRCLIELLTRTESGLMGLTMGRIFFFGTLLIMAWRCILFLRYRPLPLCADENLPRCTIVVPAYNEGSQVLLTLRSLAASDYPSEKVQIIAVDDGSVDDTWHYIAAAARELGGRIKTIRFPKNLGKRHALYAGFRQGAGTILVTVDSDSIVEPQTIRRLVGPFAMDERIGAIAGNVRVLNHDDGIIPKMLDVIFYLSFDFIRAGQSMVKTVMCTPGALSAYRAEAVERILPRWLEQKFCGRPSNIGEDRAITNMVLQQGYHVLFQKDAMVYTTVPAHYRNLCLMFLRWARSNVRESLMMAQFAFRRFRPDSMLGARINLAYDLLCLARAPFIMLSTLALLVWQPVLFGSMILCGALVSSSVSVFLYAWKYRTGKALLGYVYGFFWFFALSWIPLYALVTVHRSGWLTREAETGAQTGLYPQEKRKVRMRLAIAKLLAFFIAFALYHLDA